MLDTRPWLMRAAVMAAACLALGFGPAFAQQRTVQMSLADGFDFPVGPPNGEGYYKARGLRLVQPVHFGEDWNGRAGGDTDMGAPVYAMGDGLVTWAYDVRVGWGNVILVRHAYREPGSGQVRYCDSLYGHLRDIFVRVGQMVRRGQKIGTIGNNHGMYPAHLHFEVRHNLSIGMMRENVPRTTDNWADPTAFITRYRRLNREWRMVPVPLGTYQEYQGYKGL